MGLDHSAPCWPDHAVHMHVAGTKHFFDAVNVASCTMPPTCICHPVLACRAAPQLAPAAAVAVQAHGRCCCWQLHQRARLQAGQRPVLARLAGWVLQLLEQVLLLLLLMWVLQVLQVLL